MRMTIKELLETISMIAEKYPNAEVDFVYPRRHKERTRSVLAALSGYEVLLLSYGVIVRFCIDNAPSERRSGLPPLDDESTPKA